MNKFYSILLALSLYTGVALAQQGLLAGKVIDKEQNFSLPGANLKIVEINRHTVTHQDGSYEFLNVPVGKYTLIVTYIGYRADTVRVEIADGQSTHRDLYVLSGAIIGKEVVVLGDRLRGQAKALNQQKNNLNISNIVSSDQVGRFPDANIGDALKRVSGVTMQNDQGEARDIIIRGLAPELNSVTLNGSRIPSAEGDNRRVQMDLIPSDMIQTIEVNKTLTSDMDADAIGGSVNLVTRTAPNALRISGTLSSGYNPIRGKALYTGSAVAANRFLDKKLGVVFSLSYNNNDYGSDNVEFKYLQSKSGTIYINEQEIRKYNVQRVRRSANLALDYQIDKKNTLFLSGMYNWRDDWENRFRYNPRKIKENGGLMMGDVRNQTKGGINNNRNKGARLEDQRVKNVALKGKHIIGESMALDWDMTYAKASEERPNERYLSWTQKKVTFEQDLSLVHPLNKALNYQPLDMDLDKITENHNYTSENELSGRINLRLPLNLIQGQKGRLRFGLRGRLKQKIRNNNYFEYKPIGDTKALFSKFQNIPYQDMTDPNFQAGPYQLGLVSFPTAAGNLDLNNASLFQKKDRPSEYLAVNYKAKENIYSGYVRFDQDMTKNLTLITGLRIEHTMMDYQGNFVQDKENLEGVQAKKSSYVNWLPNLAFRYTPSNDMVLRAAFSTSIARPNYYDITPFVNTIVGDLRIKAGNPLLKAAYAYNYDVMFEQYFKSVGMLSGGVFAKKINHFIYQYTIQNYLQSDFARDYPNFTNPIESTDQNWAFQQARNGESVNVYGFELTLQRQLDFLPGILKNLGIYANYTFTRSKAKGISDENGNPRTHISLPGTSPNMYNLSLSYEDKRLSVRLSGNFADAYIDELGGSAFADRYYDKQFFLDANASFKLSSKLRIFAEANNLTNQPLRYYQGISSRPAQVEYYRPRYNIGVKYDLF